MIISVNWLKKFTDITVPIDELATLIGARLVEIEGVKELPNKYKDVIVVKVVECKEVEGSDHLHVTKIDDGGVAKDVERDENGYVQVVCGAPNVREGLLTAWLPPKSTVPESFETNEPFILDVRNLQNFKSNGMLASAKELDLFEDHRGILEIDKDTAPGTLFADLYELNDSLLDIENKSLTHRPDTFGIVGFAREVAAIQGNTFTTPEFLRNLAPTFDNDGSIDTPTVTIDDPALSDRYQAIVVSGAKEHSEAPLEIQTYLGRSGVRPINAIVDVTNMLMLATGQPLHAFDYDKLLKVSGGRADIHVRAAKEGETLTLLDGRTIQLDTTDIVIAAGDTPIALAGAMGGSETEIDATTKNIIIESATFNLYNLRTTQMRHGIFSEAITRFTKGQPAELTAPVLAEAVRLVGEFTGAKPVSAAAEAYPGKHDPITIDITSQFVNTVLGADLSVEVMVKTLQNVEFTVEVSNDTELHITVPYWRQDIHIPEDIIEEIGRINGYDDILLTLPWRDFTAIRPSAFDRLRSTVRALLVRAGANEVLTYSFVHGDMMRKAGQNVDEAYRIVNSISPDLQYYRQSLTPSLINQIHPNIKAGYDHFALFEFNKFHTKKHELTEEKVPKELDSLAFVVSRSKEQSSAAYYEAKRYLDFIATELHLEFVYEPLEEDSNYPVTRPFESKRSARVFEKQTHEPIGVIGEFTYSVVKAFKLPTYSAGFEISPLTLLKLTEHQPADYRASSKFPGSERDVCFQVSSDTAYADIIKIVNESLASVELEVTVEPIDIYQPVDGSTKNITVRIKLTSLTKTLTSQDVQSVIEQVQTAVTTALHATIV